MNDDLFDIKAPHVWCAHCGRRLSTRVHTVTLGGASTSFHGDRAACRVAAHEKQFGARPDAVRADDEAFGDALAGVDCIRWPWWLRWLAADRFSRVHGQIARAVAASVQQAHERRKARP